MKTLDEIIGIQTEKRILLHPQEIKRMLIEASQQAFNAGSAYGHDSSLSFVDGKPIMQPDWKKYFKQITK